MKDIIHKMSPSYLCYRPYFVECIHCKTIHENGIQECKYCKTHTNNTFDIIKKICIGPIIAVCVTLILKYKMMK